MKIVVVETDAAGGLIHFAYQLAEGLQQVGVETTLLTGRRYELADLPHCCTVAPILNLWSPVEDQPSGGLGEWWYRRSATLRRASRGFRLAVEWRRMVRYIKKENPDVVLFSMIRFPFLSIYLRELRGSGIRLAQMCHEFQDRESRPGIGGRILRRLFPDVYGQFDTVFLLSNSAQDDFRAMYPEHSDKTVLVPHGPELVFQPSGENSTAAIDHYNIRSDEQVVLMFGGLRPSKGVPDLIKAFASLKGRPNTRLIVAGYPSREFDKDEVTGLVSSLGLQNHVTLDFRYLSLHDLGAMVSRADVVAFPYLSATSSGALALAQTEARPILATAVGGLLGAIHDGVTGRLVPKGDTAAMGDALRDLLDHPEEANRMAIAGQQEILRDRSWPLIARRIVDALSVAESGRA